jgi:DNA-binding NarL/FixJ family response regulator
MTRPPGRFDPFIALIESRTPVQDLIRRGVQVALSWPVATYSTVSELERQPGDASPDLLILSLADASVDACARALKKLLELFPSIPIIVLASENDAGLAWTAVSHGPKGYLSCTTGFEIAGEAARFVLAE